MINCLQTMLQKRGPKYLFVPESMYQDNFDNRGVLYSLPIGRFYVITMDDVDLAKSAAWNCGTVVPDNISILTDIDAKLAIEGAYD